MKYKFILYSTLNPKPPKEQEKDPLKESVKEPLKDPLNEPLKEPPKELSEGSVRSFKSIL